MHAPQSNLWLQLIKGMVSKLISCLQNFENQSQPLEKTILIEEEREMLKTKCNISHLDAS